MYHVPQVLNTEAEMQPVLVAAGFSIFSPTMFEALGDGSSIY